MNLRSLLIGLVVLLLPLLAFVFTAWREKTARLEVLETQQKEASIRRQQQVALEKSRSGLEVGQPFPLLLPGRLVPIGNVPSIVAGQPVLFWAAPLYQGGEGWKVETWPPAKQLLEQCPQLRLVVIISTDSEGAAQQFASDLPGLIQQIEHSRISFLILVDQNWMEKFPVFTKDYLLIDRNGRLRIMGIVKGDTFSNEEFSTLKQAYSKLN